MSTNNFKHGGLTKEIIKCAYQVHNYLGSGFLESIYETALEKELTSNGLQVERQQPISVEYKGEVIGQFKLDMLVDKLIIVELKAVETIHPAHEVQLVNYLKATDLEVGLLLNFGSSLTFKRRVFTNKK